MYRGTPTRPTFESAVAFLVGYTAAEYDVLVCAEINYQTPHAIVTSLHHRRDIPTPSTRVTRHPYAIDDIFTGRRYWWFGKKRSATTS